MPEDLDAKIDAINPDDYVPEDRAEIVARKQQWHEANQKLVIQNDWVGHPGTKQLKRIKEQRLAEINLKLSDDESIDIRERDRLLGEKRAIKADLALFNAETGKALELLAAAVEDQLTR
jgi:hypothetical protein